MTAVPDWLATADAEERAELAALGIVSDTQQAPKDQVERDALASRMLRAMALLQRELEETRKARDLEIQYITERYTTRADRLIRRYQFLENGVKALAEQSDFGDKKSRDVGFGTYGRRLVPERIIVTDEQAALEWAEQQLPQAVKCVVTLPLDQLPEDLQPLAKRSLYARELTTVLRQRGQIAPGTAIQAAYDEPYAKPVQSAPLEGKGR